MFVSFVKGNVNVITLYKIICHIIRRKQKKKFFFRVKCKETKKVYFLISHVDVHTWEKVLRVAESFGVCILCLHHVPILWSDEERKWMKRFLLSLRFNVQYQTNVAQQGYAPAPQQQGYPEPQPSYTQQPAYAAPQCVAPQPTFVAQPVSQLPFQGNALRAEAPVSQKPAPIYQSQPVASTFQGECHC